MNYVELISEIDNPPHDFSAMKLFASSILKSLDKNDWQMGLVITDDDGIRNYNRLWRMCFLKAVS